MLDQRDHRERPVVQSGRSLRHLLETRARAHASGAALADGDVYLFVEGRESVAQTTIHMLFVFFPIAVVWLDAREARRRQGVGPALPALLRAESPGQVLCARGVPSLLDRVSVGDQLDFA